MPRWPNGAKNPKAVEAQRKFVRAHPERRRAYARKWYQNNRAGELARSRLHNLKKYGLTVDQFEALAAAQDHRCAICHRVRKLHVDHNHTTHEVRGLLCFACNVTLGYMSESPERLEVAANYLRRYD